MATYKLISSATLGSGGGSFTFSSIPATYTDLELKLSIASTSSTQNVYGRFNGDTGNNYNFQNLRGYNSAATASNDSGEGFNNVMWLGFSQAISNVFGVYTIFIPNYASSNYKVCHSYGGTESTAATSFTSAHCALWQNTSAITSITIQPASGNFAQYSTAYLYGISNA